MKTTHPHGKIRLGIIGCGIAARDLHWPALAKLGDRFEVTALCNHHPEKAEDLADLMVKEAAIPRPAIFSDWRELFASGLIDAADIMLPVELNPEACAAALAAGLHVIAEKPIARDRAEARAMMDLEAKYPGRAFMIAENFRYRPMYDRARALIASGELGRPYAVDWRAWQLLKTDNKYARTEWRQHHQYEGGFLTDGGVHNVAALRDFFGELEFRGSALASVNPAIGRTDSLFWTFATKSGVIGNLSLMFAAHGPNRNEMSILCEKGSLVMGWDWLQIWKDETMLSEEKFAGGEDYVAELVDFHKAVTTGTKPLGSLAEAAKDLDAILEALEKAGRVIDRDGREARRSTGT